MYNISCLSIHGSCTLDKFDSEPVGALTLDAIVAVEPLRWNHLSQFILVPGYQTSPVKPD